MKQVVTDGKELRVSRDTLDKISEFARQWMTLEEHWTAYNLNRRQQLEYAGQFFNAMEAELKQAYSNPIPINN